MRFYSQFYWSIHILQWAAGVFKRWGLDDMVNIPVMLQIKTAHFPDVHYVTLWERNKNSPQSNCKPGAKWLWQLECLWNWARGQEKDDKRENKREKKKKSAFVWCCCGGEADWWSSGPAHLFVQDSTENAFLSLPLSLFLSISLFSSVFSLSLAKPLSVCLSTALSICLSIYLQLFAYLSVYLQLSVCLFIVFFFHFTLFLFCCFSVIRNTYLVPPLTFHFTRDIYLVHQEIT